MNDQSERFRTAVYRNLPEVVNLHWLKARSNIAARVLSLAGALVAHYIGFANWVAAVFLIAAFASIILIADVSSEQPPKWIKDATK